MLLSIKVTPEATADNPAELPNPAPSTAGMTTKVVKGSLWTLAGQIAPLAISLITTPFVIRMLGAESYGVLILIGLIPTYLGFADFGMGLASTKFVSEAFAEGDLSHEARIVRTAALVALCSSLPIAFSIFAFSSRIIALFNVPENLHAEASIALKLASVTFVLNFLNNIFNTPQLTRLRMDLNTFIGSGFRILGLVATPFAIYIDGVVGAVFVLMTSGFLTLLGHLFVSRRLNPFLFELSVDRQIIRSMLRFGGAMLTAGVAGMVLANLEKGAVSAIVSPRALAYYYIAFTLVSMMTMFSGAMVQSLLPAFSQLQAGEKREQLNSLYSRGIKLNLIWMIPALVFLSLIAKDFFTRWAGDDFGRESILPFYIMLAGIVVNISAYFPYVSLMAAGRTDSLAKLYWAEVVPYILIVWALTTNFGILGAAVAWSARAIVDAILIFVLAEKLAGVRYAFDRTTPLAIAALVMIIPFLLNLFFPELSVIMLALATALSIGYGAIIWTRVLSIEEVTWLMERVKARFAR